MDARPKQHFFVNFTESNTPKYANLSHIWRNGKITYQDYLASPMPQAQQSTKKRALRKSGTLLGLQEYWVITTSR